MLPSSVPTPAQEEFRKLTSPPDNDSDHRASSPASSTSRSVQSSRCSETGRASNYQDSCDNIVGHGHDDSMRILPNLVLPSRQAANGPDIKFPPASFDSGHATGVKGVIADARSFYEAARRARSKTQLHEAVHYSLDGLDAAAVREQVPSRGKGGDSGTDDDESFLSRWRESRRRELESGVASDKVVRNRRTSPSVRTYGRMVNVDALGYLDAIEKVPRDTVVVVFVYDPECDVSSIVEAALDPLVTAHPLIRFVKILGDEIDFDNAGVPALLAYRNQGDLFANLTGMVESMIEHDDDGGSGFGPDALRALLHQHHVM